MPGETRTVTNLVVEVNMTKLEKLRNQSLYWLRKVWWRVTMPVRRVLDTRSCLITINSIYDGIDWDREPTREEYWYIALEIDGICDSMILQWDVDFTQNEKVCKIYEFLGIHANLHDGFTWAEALHVFETAYE